MVKRLLAAALSAMFFAAVSTAPVVAQTTQPAKKEAPAPKAPTATEKKKEPSAKQLAQRQKMKDCSTKWNEHKKTAKEKGRKAHNAFMGECLKN